MVAPAGEHRSASTPGSVGRETAGQIAPSRGSTSPAYKMTGAAITKGDRMIRAVHCQRGRRIITAQMGRTNRLLARKSKSIRPPLRTVTTRSRTGSGGKSDVSECHSRFPLVVLLHVARVNILLLRCCACQHGCK